jgi:RNA polymerase sigma-70 factor (sigma-E family)
VDGSDQQDFEAFVVAQLQPLLRLARLLTGNDHDAWDLVQDCLIRVGAKWSSLDSARDPFAYARRTLVNLNLNRLRRRRREVTTDDVPDLPMASAPENTGWLLPALRNLPSRQRAALVLHYYEGLGVNEISEVLGCSPSSAKTHLRRGRAALADEPIVRESRSPEPNSIQRR